MPKSNAHRFQQTAQNMKVVLFFCMEQFVTWMSEIETIEMNFIFIFLL